MKITTLVLFWSFLGTYLFIYVANQIGYRLCNPIQFYLADLLAVPVTATLGLWLMKHISRWSEYMLKRWHVIYVVALFCTVFEMLLPMVMQRYTGDIIDVVMYIIGGLFFWKMMNK